VTQSAGAGSQWGPGKDAVESLTLDPELENKIAPSLPSMRMAEVAHFLDL